MTVTRHRILISPFNPVRSFTALACGLESITLKDPVMFDLQHAIDQSRKLHETLVMAKGAHVAGGDPAPIIADALARLPEVANAMGHFADPTDPPAPEDESARRYAEGHRQEAAE
jgi:hypothetical protein